MPVYVSSESQKAKRFQQGLKPEIRSGVVALQLTTYTSVVQAALVIESELKLAAKEKGDKKRKIDNVRINLNQVDPAKGFKGELEGIGTRDSIDRTFPPA